MPEPVELCVPADVETSQILAALARSFEVVPGSATRFDRSFLDTFDGRLHRAGMTAWRERKNGRAAVVVVDAPRTRRAEAEVASPASRSPDRVLVADMAPGAVRDTLAGVVDVRALLPTVRVRGRSVAVALRNQDGKTVAHMAIEDPVATARAQEAKPLGRRVLLSAPLGYQRQRARAEALLVRHAGLEPATVPLALEAASALGLPVEGRELGIDVGLDAGMRTDEAMVLVCRRLADIVDANLPGTLADVDVEFLHDLRVAIRRSRSVLKELKAVLPADGERQTRADLRWIQEVTGPTRDLDVQLQEWPATVASASASRAGDLEPLHDLLQRHRSTAFTSMRRTLKSRRFRGAWERWRALLDEPGRWSEAAGPRAGVPIGELAGGRIVSVYRAMVRMGRAIDDRSPPEALHDLRKRGKELRYLLELFGGMWPSRTVKPLVSALKDLQDVLGRFQDDEIQCAYLRRLGPELATAPGGTDALIALGVVIEDLAADQRRARAEFAARFDAFARADNRKLVKRTFASHHRNGRRHG